MERIKLASIFAEARGKKIAEQLDFFMADTFLKSGLMLEHDRKIRKQAIEDMACWIPETVPSLSSGESATHWLANKAKELE